MTIDDIKADETLSRIYLKMLDYLGRGDMAEKRLVMRIVRLKRRYPDYAPYQGYTMKNAWSVLPYLREQGYVNERAYAERLCEALMNKRDGIRMIRRKLLARDIEPKIVDAIVRSYREQEVHQDLQRIITVTKHRYVKALERYKGQRMQKMKARQSLYSWLAMRGFEAGEVQEIINQTILTD